MGLFSGLGKLVGKVVKTGLSVATGGKSDAVLKVVSNVTGIGKPKAKPAMTTADAMNVLRYQPNVTTGRTTYAEGSGSAMPGLRRRTPPKPKKKKAAPKKPAKKAPTKAAKPRSTAKKAPPKGGLDLAKIGQMWTAAGKGPGTGITWNQFVKANSNVRK